MFSKLYLTIAFLVLFSIPHNAQIFFVKADASGANNGSSWENAYSDLSLAIKEITSGEIWVAAGTYLPSLDATGNIPSNQRDLAFTLKENLALYGGFNGTETILTDRNFEENETILSGDIGVPEDSTDNSYHVIFYHTFNDGIGNSAILDGFTITEGNANGQGDDGDGGGLFMYRGSPILRNNNFINNRATEGGGFYLEQFTPDEFAIIEQNKIKFNYAPRGAGIAIGGSVRAKISENIISNNRTNILFGAGQGGGILVGLGLGGHHVELFNNIIHDNFSSGDGGGIFCRGEIFLKGNSIMTNEASQGSGGGIFIDGGHNSIFTNNLIAKNKANESGGGISISLSNITLINNTIVNNESSEGRGITMISNSNPNIYGNIIWDFDNNSFGKQVLISTGCIPWFFNCNIKDGFEGITIFSDFSMAQYENGNINADPLFQNSTDNNFELTSPSPCRDAGANYIPQVFFPGLDYLQLERVIGPSIDIGAIEFDGVVNTEEILEESITNLYNNLIVSPNPSSNNVQISMEELSFESGVINVFDATGQLIESIEITQSDKINLDISSYQSGVYFAYLKSKSDVIGFSKIIKI